MAFKKVFFVLCPSYHGATLLAKLLNSHPEVVSLGDTYPSNAFDQTCGCREKVSSCAFWQNVKGELGEHYNPEASSWLGNYPGGQSFGKRMKFSDYLFRLPVSPQSVGKYFQPEELERFALSYEIFLQALSHQPSCQGRVFVDGVKNIMRLSCISAGGGEIDGIIHLSRNPGDFVASSFKNTKRAGLTGTLEHSLRYQAYHSKARRMGRYFPRLSISYEELATNTDGVLRDVFSFVGVEPLSVGQLREHFEQEWHFMGNSSLFNFDGTFRMSQHYLPVWQEKMMRFLAGPPL